MRGELKQMPREYGFNEQMAMSAGKAASADIGQILTKQIPGAVNAITAAQANDRQGVDWWVEMSSARHLAVDCKVRKEDWAATHPNEDDLALETYSVVEDGKQGWTRDEHKRCDYILWLWLDTRRFCLIPFPMLCRVFKENWQQWRDQYRTEQQFTPSSRGGYHSECVFVPRRVIWAAMYRRFGGSIVAPKEVA